MTKDTVIEKTVDMSIENKHVYCGDLQAGEFVGQYEIRELLGAGGLAKVYRAYDKDIERDVALKILRPGVAASDAAKKRFKQEINLQAKLSMPGCVSVFGVGEYHGTLYCAMEYVEGKTLRKVLREKSLDTAQTIEVLIKIAKIIKELHKRGLEHRDIKPGNIILNQYNEVVLLDFGLAKAVEDQLNICITSHGELFGTPAYMSPEQGGKDNNLYRAGRSDVYALGVLAFEMLTGDLPYAIDNLSLDEVFYIIRNDPPELVTKYNKEVPPDIEKVINEALTKDPAIRISAEDFWRGLCDGSSVKKLEFPFKMVSIAMASILAVVIAIIFIAPLLNRKVEKVQRPVKKQEKSFIIIPDTGIKMLKLNGGTFIMGNDNEGSSAKPAHRVILNSFFIAEYEISGKQYSEIMGSSVKRQGDLELPVSVSWHDANKFCRLLTLREKKAGRLPEGRVFRLPTEAEWEYACRADSTSKYFYGDTVDELADYAVYSKDKKLKSGTRKANKFALYDTLGNVWEWCYDANGKYSSLPGVNPVASGPSHIERIIRGGSAGSGINECSSSYRQAVSPHRNDPMIGFRLALGHKLGK